MIFDDSLARKETLQDKVKNRDEEAEIILQILQLAKKLKHCTYEVAEKVRHPDYIDERDIEHIRKKLDVRFWHQCLEEFQVEKFLTTTDKEKLYEKLEDEAPVFNFENVMATIHGFMNSKEATATAMIRKIYEEVTDVVFRKGNSFRATGEKRLQTGIPKSFRASIFYTYGKGLPAYISSMNSRFALIEDLERACYLVDGKLQPDRQLNIHSLVDLALRNHRSIVDGPYFQLEMFKNGNVKVTFKSLEVLKTLNHWGQKGNRLK